MTEFATPTLKRQFRDLDVEVCFEKPIGKIQLESLFDEIVVQQSLQTQNELQ
jgi:hypothetical protein